MTVSPLLIALYSRDFASLGAVIRLRGTEVYTPRYLENLTFVRVLQANGVIRTDLSAETINHVMQVLSLGIVTVGELIDSAVQPDFAATLATLGEMMQAALAPALPPAANQGKEAILAYFAGLREAMLASLIVSVTNEVE